MERNPMNLAHKILTHKWIILSVGILLGGFGYSDR